MNFSTFIDPNKGGALDMTVSPTSFDLSDLPPSESEEDIGLQEDETSTVAGVTATTFVLENNVRTEPSAAAGIQTLKAAKQFAESQRRDAEQQRRDVEEEVQRLRETLQIRSAADSTAPIMPSQHDVVVAELPVIVKNEKANPKASAVNQPKEVKSRQLLRFATSPDLKRNSKDQQAASRDQFKSAASTTDLARLREPINSSEKKARLQGLKALTAEASGSVVSQTTAASSVVDPAERRARMKSRPQKLKMLKAVSRLENVDLQVSEVEMGFALQSPSSKIGQAPREAFHQMSWPGDELRNGTTLKVHESEPLSDDSVGEIGAATVAAVNANVSESYSEDQPEDESESMDDVMAVDTTLEQSVMHLDQPGTRYSIFSAGPLLPPNQVRPAVLAQDLMDVTPAMLSSQKSLEQLDYVTGDAKLAGLFGEHLKGLRRDSLLRILDDIQEFKQIKSDIERVSLGRSIFQMYLADAAARENFISKDIVDTETRNDIRKQVRANGCDAEVFEKAEKNIRHHLALKEMPTFVKGDVYRTLGFRREKKKAPIPAQKAFQPQPTEAVVSTVPVPTLGAALFRKVTTAGPEDATVQFFADPKPIDVDEEHEDEDESHDENQDEDGSDQEEESSISDSPVTVKPSNVAPTKAAVSRAPMVSAIPTAAVISEPGIPSPAAADVTLDDILADPQELETFLSFVQSTDKKSAQKTGTNVAFLVTVNQFNNAAEQERPKVARAIYDSFLATPNKTSMRRDQKDEVEVDVSELRKRQLVSRYRNLIEQPVASPGTVKKELRQGFFDKAARDVQAFVEPAVSRYNAAKKDGSIAVRQQPLRSVPAAAAVVVAAPKKALTAAAAPVAISTVRVEPTATLAEAVEQGGAVLNAFVAFASETGRQAPAQFLLDLNKFKLEANAVKRTAAASSIMDMYVLKSAKMPLGVPEHVRSGPEVRWGIFAKRNLIKSDFFDSLSEEVVRMLQGDTWARFVSHCQKTQAVAATTDESSSILSESSHIDSLRSSRVQDESNFDFGMTLERGAIEEEIRRRLREETAEKEESDDDDGSSDSGVEDSPDGASSSSTVPVGTVSARGLDLSPSTAADLLSRLDNETVPFSMNDTVMLPKKKTGGSLPTAQSIFPAAASTKENIITEEQVSELEIRPSTRPQSFIPVKRTSSKEQMAAQKAEKFQMRAKSGVWPSRSEKLMYSEGLEGKKRARFVVLKNKSLYVWTSEADYRKTREPERVLDMDNLIRLNIVRDAAVGGLVGAATRWTLRINFDGLDRPVVLAAEHQQTLIDWKQDLLESAPHAVM